MSKFLVLGTRVINLKHVAAAERNGNRGAVTVYLVGEPSRWSFEGEEADVIWNKLTAGRGDMTDLGGGPYSIADNQTTASREPRE